MKIWATIFKNHKRRREATAVSDLDDWDAALNACLYALCYDLDVQKPMLLPKNLNDLLEYRRTLLTQDCFIEPIGFDWLELEIADEEKA